MTIFLATKEAKAIVTGQEKFSDGNFALDVAMRVEPPSLILDSLDHVFDQNLNMHSCQAVPKLNELCAVSTEHPLPNSSFASLLKLSDR